MLCLCHYGPALLSFWFQTNLGRENSASYLEMLAGKTFRTKVTRWSRFTSNFYALIGQSLTGWVHVENLCSILKLVYFDSWSWQSFVSTCVGL